MSMKEHTSDTISNINVAQEQQKPDTSRIALLAIGDALVFVVFAVIGMPSHKE